MKKTLIRLLSVVIAVCCVFGLMAPAAMAAPVADATIDENRTGSITLYKYDYTNSYKDGKWNTEDYTSIGVEDKENVNDVLGGKPSHALGNGETSNGYAIKGVEFSYLMIGELHTYSEVVDGLAVVALLYGFDADDEVLDILALDAEDIYTTIGNKNYYISDTLIAALNAVLAADPTGTRNAMEEYIVDNGGTAMPLTDADGKSSVSGLPVGLYLCVETAVPEMVTSTTAPFLLSIPTTSVDGGVKDDEGNYSVNDGGHRWIYDLVIFPKNETGIVTLEKEVKENGNDEEFSHNATASTGDVVDYQITSTLPTITSSTTYIGTYTFKDTLSTALSYNKDVVIDWYSDKDCTNHVARWDAESGKYTVVYGEDNTMTITMTAAGLAEINTGADTANNVNNAGNMKYAGYSNYTVRISYTATLHSDDSVTFGDKGNDNDVTLTWSRTSENYYDVLNDDCHVYAYGIHLVKQFSNIADNAEAAQKGLYEHVKFKVQNTTDGYWVVAELNEAEGLYYVTGTTANEEEATAFSPVTAYAGSDLDFYGRIVILGLEDDTYVMTETETANGYTLLEKNITVEITAVEDANRICGVYGEDSKGLTQNDDRYDADGIKNPVDELTNIPQTQLAHVMLTASATVDGNATTMLSDLSAAGENTDSAHATAVCSVTNTSGFDIPETGDDSMMYLTIAGSVMAICAIALMVVVFRHKKKETV